MDLEIKLKNIKENIKKIVENNNGLIKNSIDNDTNGYLYCITNNILNVYNTETYKIGNSSNLIPRLKNYNDSYFELINVKNLINVPFKTMFETLIFKKLRSNRITPYREFFTNYENINNEFILMNEILSNNEDIIALEKYYLYVMKDDQENTEKVWYNEDIYMDKRVNYNLVKKNYGTKIKNKIINYNEEKYTGYILHIEIPEISFNFDNDIQVILITKKKSLSFTEFLGKPSLLKCVKVNDITLAKLLFHDMLNGTHIKNKYFECSLESVENTINKIAEYFEIFNNSKKIIKAYLYDYYNDGEKVKPDKKLSIKKNRTKITEEEFNLNYGTNFDRLKMKIFNDDIEINIDNQYDNYILDENKNIDFDNDLNEKEYNDQIENLIKDKVNMIKEIHKNYSTRYENYLKLYDSDNNSEEELYNKLSKVYKKNKIEINNKVELKKNEDTIKILKQTYRSRTDKYLSDYEY